MKAWLKRLLKPAPSTVEIAAVDKSTSAWGDQQAKGLWDGLYARYEPVIDGRVVLDLGCSWGYMLKHLLETFNPRKCVGTDLSPMWDERQSEWNWRAWGDRLEFHAGDLTEIDEIERGSVDLVLCTSVLQYMKPDHVEATLNKVYDLLRPGGEMIVRTRCVTSYIGQDLHSYYKTPFPHLLHSRRDLAEDVQARTGKRLRHLNFLTATSYLLIFHRAGFEIADVRRRPNKAAPEIQKKIAAMYPWISPEELNCAELECRLVRPYEPEDLAAIAE